MKGDRAIGIVIGLLILSLGILLMPEALGACLIVIGALIAGVSTDLEA